MGLVSLSAFAKYRQKNTSSFELVFLFSLLRINKWLNQIVLLEEIAGNVLD